MKMHTAHYLCTNCWKRTHSTLVATFQTQGNSGGLCSRSSIHPQPRKNMYEYCQNVVLQHYGY